MNKIYLLPYLIGLFCLTLIASCNTPSDETPTPASGPLSGSVQLWDDKISSLSDHSGVTVTVDDLTDVSATTDAMGKYSFDKLPYGLHDLTIRKSGYGTYRLFGVSNANSTTGTMLPTVQLGKLATTTVTSLTVSGTTYNENPGVSVQYSVSPTPTATNRGYVRYFLSTDPGVSNISFRCVSPILSVLNNNTTGGFSKEDLLTAGFTTGQTVYLRLYGESVQSNTYTDPNVGVPIFPNINPSTVGAVSFVMP